MLSDQLLKEMKSSRLQNAQTVNSENQHSGPLNPSPPSLPLYANNSLTPNPPQRCARTATPPSVASTSNGAMDQCTDATTLPSSQRRRQCTESCASIADVRRGKSRLRPSIVRCACLCWASSSTRADGCVRGKVEGMTKEGERTRKGRRRDWTSTGL